VELLPVPRRAGGGTKGRYGSCPRASCDVAGRRSIRQSLPAGRRGRQGHPGHYATICAYGTLCDRCGIDANPTICAQRRICANVTVCGNGASTMHGTICANPTISLWPAANRRRSQMPPPAPERSSPEYLTLPAKATVCAGPVAVDQLRLAAQMEVFAQTLPDKVLKPSGVVAVQCYKIGAAQMVPLPRHHSLVPTRQGKTPGD
jgi:hypothetical protein